MSEIEFFEDIFDEPFCTFLLSNARARLADSAEFRTNFHWMPSIRKSSAVVLVRDYDPTIAKLILARLIDRGLVAHENYHVMNYAWTRLSYIPWHNDGKSDEALTIYLNDQWELDWGGLFLYRDEADQIRAYPPRFNCGLKNSGNILHSTTPVSLEAPEPRFTLQLFSKGPRSRRGKPAANQARPAA